MVNFSLEEARDVIGNSQNPNHQAFHKNTNAEVVSAVNQAFERAYPGSFELGSDPKLEAQMESALNDLPQQDQKQNQNIYSEFLLKLARK